MGGETGATGSTGATGATGATGDTGPAGAEASVLPFSLSKYGSTLTTDSTGSPLAIDFAGAGGSYSGSAIYLEEGVWDTGIIRFSESMLFPNSFILPREGVLQRIYAVFSTSEVVQFTDDSTVHPFICIATADPNAESLVFTILQETLTDVGTYNGGIAYDSFTLRSASRADLNVFLPEGTLVGIIAGIRNDATESISARFAVSGGLFIE